jgi:hypothetical protein
MLALAYGGEYLQMQPGPREPAAAIISDVSTLRGSDIIGAEQCNGLIRALLRQAKLLKGCISVVLSQGHPAIEEVIHSCPGITALWVLYAVLVLHGSGIAYEVLFYKPHLVPFRRVDGCIELEYILNSADNNREVLQLMATIVKPQEGRALCRQFNRNTVLRCQGLDESVQRLTILVGIPA